MALNVASLNVRGLRDPSKCERLLAEQEIHFTCAEDCRVLEGDFVVFLAFGSCCSAEVSLTIGRHLNAIVNLVFEDDGGRLVVVDIAAKSFEFRVVTVYAPNSVSFFRLLGPFLDDSKRLVLVSD